MNGTPRSFDSASNNRQRMHKAANVARRTWDGKQLKTHNSCFSTCLCSNWKEAAQILPSWTLVRFVRPGLLSWVLGYIHFALFWFMNFWLDQRGARRCWVSRTVLPMLLWDDSFRLWNLASFFIFTSLFLLLVVCFHHEITSEYSWVLYTSLRYVIYIDSNLLNYLLWVIMYWLKIAAINNKPALPVTAKGTVKVQGIHCTITSYLIKLRL